jgi:hypothetical protein
MASKKSKNKKINKPVEQKAGSKSSTRILQIIFLVLSVLIVLSMILAATATF